jgi:colanic acid/amylovoran biosynthesis glycosyltransferase
VSFRQTPLSPRRVTPRSTNSLYSFITANITTTNHTLPYNGIFAQIFHREVTIIVVFEVKACLSTPAVRVAAPTPLQKAPTRLAYLVSEYPAISHTFVLREVKNLRIANFEIWPASINSPYQPVAAMAADDRAEAATTFYIKKVGAMGAARSHLRTLLKRPIAYFRGLGFALSLGGPDLRELLYSIFYFIEAVILGDWMEEHELSHVHVHFANPASTVAMISSQVFAVGFSFTVHGPDEFYDVRGQHLSEKIEKASFVLCIGYFARSQLMKVSPMSNWSKFELAPLGVDLAVFDKRPPLSVGVPFRILCVGRLVPSKGQHILIAAIDNLIKDGRNISLKFIGDGPDRVSLDREVNRRGLREHITFEGSVNQDRIHEFYREADAFALASFAEGIPVVLMEAMAMEIPCVSTMITGIPELIRNEIDGLLVMPSDRRALADAIGRLIDDETLRHRLGQAGRRRVAEKYDLDKNIERLSHLFRARLTGGEYDLNHTAGAEIL